MPRVPIAAVAGLAGFAAYIALVLILADRVATWHWSIQAVYFVIAGTIWVLPARWLIYWAARLR